MLKTFGFFSDPDPLPTAISQLTEPGTEISLTRLSLTNFHRILKLDEFDLQYFCTIKQ